MIKSCCAILVGFLSAVPGSQGQGRLMGIDLPTVVERGPHHRVLEQVLRYQTASGQSVERTRSYTEIATGMHYLDASKKRWMETQLNIDIFDGYARAQQGPMQITFLANLNSSGAIQITCDGQRYTSHLIALTYSDARTGQSVVIAEIQDAIGEVQPGGRVLYRDAFDGPRIDVLYTCTLAGFEQDLLLRESLPDPRLFGIEPPCARVEVLTEFLEAPQPVKTPLRRKRTMPAHARAAMAEPDLIDETLRFGASLMMGAGGAFRVEDRLSDPLNQSTIPISKRWIQLGQRRFLCEIVDYSEIEPELRLLPQLAPPSTSQRKAQVQHHSTREQLAERLPRLPAVQAAQSPMRMANLPAAPLGPCLVWDYAMTIGQTNFTFQGDRTYFVRGDVHLLGTTRIEAGAVIKFTNSSTASRLLFQGPVACLTSPWNPAILTSMADNSVGEILSTNAVEGYYGSRMMEFSTPGQDIVLHDLKLRHAAKGLVVSAGHSLSVTNLQLGNFHTGLEVAGGCAVNLLNTLIYDGVVGLVLGPDSTVHGEHITFHRLQRFRSKADTAWPMLTNALIVACLNHVAFYGESVATNTRDVGIFSIAKSGAHYLPEHSPYRDAGTPQINPALSLALRKSTTSPPVVLTHAILGQGFIFSPLIPRDLDTPDLGYHYPAIDFAISHAQATNATVLLTNGVVIAAFGSEGLALGDHSRLVSQGTPFLPNVLTRCLAIQENAGTWDGNAPGATITTRSTTGAPPSVHLRFTHAFVPAGGGDHIATNPLINDSLNDVAALEIKDSLLSGGGLTLDLHSPALCGFTNNLLERIDWFAQGDAAVIFCNNLIRGGRGTLVQSSPRHSWVFKDNLVDTCELQIFASAQTRGNNAYFHSPNLYSADGPGSTELVLAQLSYVTGLLGPFYQPAGSRLIDAGSRSASQAGLSHYTVMASEDAEADSTVDIGLHYVATHNGVPRDQDGDGLPDYAEDLNGNGFMDAFETDGRNADSDNDGISDGMERRQGRNPLAAQTAAGTFRFLVYTTLQAPTPP